MCAQAVSSSTTYGENGGHHYRRREVNDTAKFVVLWRFNPSAPWPADPTQMAMGMEMMFAAIDNTVRTGQVLEHGFFPDGKSGYAISTGEPEDAFRRAFAFYPWIESDAHDIVPYETGKEIARGVLKAQAEAMKR